MRRGVEGNTTENTALMCAALGMPKGTAAGVSGWKERKKRPAPPEEGDVAPVVGFATVFRSDSDLGYAGLELVLNTLQTPDEAVGEMPLCDRPSTRVVLSANALLVLALGILPAPLLNLCARAIAASL